MVAEASSDEIAVEVVAALETLEIRRDAEGLLAFFEQDRTLVRFEALRAYLRLEDPRTTARLVELLEKESDEDAQELLGEALAAGGGASDAASLARLFEDPSPTRRAAAAAATLEIAEREPLPPGLTASASATLEALADADARGQDR